MPGTCRRRTYIREWRKHRGLSQEKLGAAVGLDHASISRMERGFQPYSQQNLEDIAVELGTDPASLLARDPRDPEGIWSIWDRVSAVDRPRAIEILKALIKDEK